MKNVDQFRLLWAVVLGTFAMYSCADDEEYLPSLPEAAIIAESDESAIAQGDTLVFNADVESDLESSFYWSVDGVKVSEEETFKFFTEEMGAHVIMLTIENPDGEASDSREVEVYGKYRFGTFILNEGNMTTENGTLVFVSPKGYITDSVYIKANGTALGNVAQDLFIADESMYIISQNGNSNGGDGILVVADAETLHKQTAYQEELSSLSWPSHVATLGADDIFIRDNNGIHLFKPSTGALALVEGSKGAIKNRMAVVGEKLFVPGGKSVMVIEKGVSQVSYTITFEATVTGVLKSSDDHIWVSTSGSPSKIHKINASDYSVVKTNEISEINLGAGWGATPAISAKGDTLYFSNASTTIYRHVFSNNTTDFMTDVKDHVEDANIVYNNLAVNPKTGEVYFNTLKGYGLNYLINDISVFDFSGEEAILAKNYKNYTNFPAGIFFTYDYE
ncbi:DUF5074 domain-containing protein [Echinicola rosea]|uniref:DUF5074 domain-containing protein n=1 Tax=Echinicola rosea TaxID=1807691 RepID=A0ABQ1UY78_9BACT|nr:DUF5074 domain-containing protein [Echinicola rosea]GGF29108.1 hypothetical protein GCM10011339_16690 [Echinicola rosea]